MARRLLIFVLLGCIGLLQVAVADQPASLEMTLDAFIQAYNALPTVKRPLTRDTEDREEQLHGIIYMPANDAVDVYVQLAYDQNADRIHFVGAVMDASDEPCFEDFMAVIDHLMAVVFPELSPEARAAMIGGAIIQADHQGVFAEDGARVTEYADGERGLRYFVYDGNERQAVVYRVK